MKLTPCGRYYETPDGTLPRVSKVLDSIGKPWLEKWEARLEREMVVQAAVNLYSDLPDGPKMSSLAYSMSLNQRIGKEKAADRVIQKAQGVGTRVHHLIQWELHKELGLKVGKTPMLEMGEDSNAFDQYRAWRESVHLAPVAVEQVVWNAQDRYAGQLDLLSRVNGELAVVDFKTSKAVYPEYELQAAAYAKAVNAVVGQPVSRAYVVRLPKRVGDGFEVWEVPDLVASYRVFLNVLEVWKWTEERRRVRDPVGDHANAG